MGVLSNRHNLLDTYWKSFFERHLSLTAHRESLKQDKYFTHDLFSDLEAAYILAKSDLTTRLSTLVGALQATLGQGANAPNLSTTPRISTTALSLPKLQLPKFKGN